MRDPFPHLRLEEVFPEDVYAAMLASLPPPDLYRPDNLRKYTRPDGRCSRALVRLPVTGAALPPTSERLWSAVHTALGSPDVARAFAERFGLPDAGFPRTELVRDLPGYWIEPHPDTRAKRITTQFYLAPDDSRPGLGTVLYRFRPLRAALTFGRTHVMERAGQFPFTPNSGYAFARRWNSFHGVERLPEDAGERHTLMHVYYRSQARAI